MRPKNTKTQKKLNKNITNTQKHKNSKKLNQNILNKKTNMKNMKNIQIKTQPCE